MLLVWRPGSVGALILLSALLGACDFGSAAPPATPVSRPTLAWPPTATWTALPTATHDIIYARPTPAPNLPSATPSPRTSTQAAVRLAPRTATGASATSIIAGTAEATAPAVAASAPAGQPTTAPAVEVVDVATPIATEAAPPAAASPTPEPPTSTPLPATPTPRAADADYSGPFDPFGPDRDCGDFDTHAEAQAFYAAAGGPSDDPHRLDNNKDGMACESLP